ncbi:MAG: KH domain-containing protein, partial [Elusimicrobiota bacterium]
MGNKIHPRSVRLGYIQDWESKWFSLRDMPALIGEDFKIRRLVRDRFRLAAVSWVGIERAGSYLRVNIHTARPGVVIGK